jgi:hypothetical protein
LSWCILSENHQLSEWLSVFTALESMDELTQGVESSAPSSTEQSVVESPTTVEPSGESQGSVTATDEAQSTQVEPQIEEDPLKDIPTVEELQQLAAQKIPHAQALAQLRPAYEGLKAQVDSYKTLDPWKPLVETIGDPALAQTSYELMSSIHTPSQENPTGFSTVPFLEQIEQQSPGTPDQLFADLLTFQVENEQGMRDTLVRHLYRSHGLNPDRIDEYRNIDNLRASGVVTDEQLGKIPEKYHEAFKALTQDAREDILSLKESNPALADQYLRNAERSLASERFEQEQRERETKAQEQAQAQFEQRVTQAQEQDLSERIQFLHDSIHQSLKSHSFSSDPTTNTLEHRKILGVLANLHNPFPVYRQMAEQTLKDAGVDIGGYYDLVNVYEQERAKLVRYTSIGDQMQTSRAKAAATQAEQRILTKLNAWAGVLAKSGGDRAASVAAEQENLLATASARFIPNGNGTLPQGAQNPYAANPHAFGTQEYRAWNKKMDQEVGLTKAQMFGGN